MNLLEALKLRRLFRVQHPEAVALWLGERLKLEARREALASDLRREPEPGEIREPYARRVKAGPVPVINLKRQRGALDVLAAVIVVHLLVLGGIISDAHARRGGCPEIAARYIDARNAGGLAEIRARRALIREHCYIEDAYN